MIYRRQLDLSSLIKKKSLFLMGPRGTGKTFLIGQNVKADRVWDLLDDEIFAKLTRRPKLLGEGIEKKNPVIVIDEIQKLPRLLDEVHRLIESREVRFLMTGSSARKLKRKGANLLAGRAWQAGLFPLTSAEIPDFSLIRYLNRGGLPSNYNSNDAIENLSAYVDLYLRQEIVEEALTRKVENFVRFLDVLGVSNGEELNFQSLASDCGVPHATLHNYLMIIEDTLLGFSLPAFTKSKKRKAITRSKFYFFDIGVTNILGQRGEIKPKSELFGKAFEHFLLLELRAYLNYRRLRTLMYYWRSTSKFEVDCIVGKSWAFEFKSTDLVSEKHLKGLRALREEGLIKNYAIISQDTEKRKVDGILVYPWKDFLTDLWADKLRLDVA